MKKMSAYEAVMEILETHKLTKYRLSKILGCSPSYVDKILTKTIANPRAKTCYNFYKVYGILIDSFNSEAELLAYARNTGLEV